MIEIGGMPILWHIMKTYSYYGFNEFIICAGYKQHVIKECFADFEKGPLVKLVEKKELVGYIHKGYWQCMDTLREKQQLEKIWESGNAPWKMWEE